MSFYDSGDRTARELAPGILARTFWGERMLLAVVDLAPAASLPRHAHPHEQTGYVVAGTLELTIADETRLLHAGAVYVIPGGVEHSARSPHGPTRIIDSFSPVRDEYTFDEHTP